MAATPNLATETAGFEDSIRHMVSNKSKSTKTNGEAKQTVSTAPTPSGTEEGSQHRHHHHNRGSRQRGRGRTRYTNFDEYTANAIENAPVSEAYAAHDRFPHQVMSRPSDAWPAYDSNSFGSGRGGGRRGGRGGWHHGSHESEPQLLDRDQTHRGLETYVDPSQQTIPAPPLNGHGHGHAQAHHASWAGRGRHHGQRSDAHEYTVLAGPPGSTTALARAPVGPSMGPDSFERHGPQHPHHGHHHHRGGHRGGFEHRGRGDFGPRGGWHGRGGFGGPFAHPREHENRSWHDRAPQYDHYRHVRPQENNDRRRGYLENISGQVFEHTRITDEELQIKEAFRQDLEQTFHSVLNETEKHKSTPMSLQNFGSLRSGFATKGSDMDLVIVSESAEDNSDHISMKEDGLARRLEKRLLDQGIGARLLTRARVPIIKVCQMPSPELLQALRDARNQWDALPEHEKYDDNAQRLPAKADKEKDTSTDAEPESKPEDEPLQDLTSKLEQSSLTEATIVPPQAPENPTSDAAPAQQRDPTKKAWLREKKKGPLDFPNDGVGIQCDINFFNPLGLHNTQMLRCYSLCDDRVQQMVLTVKAWAKRRKINSSYSGTLSSYGYVLMVLHYLVNVANPPVLPNLQLAAQSMDSPIHRIDGWDVSFWNDAEAITKQKLAGTLTRNTESVGALLSGFFQYFASPAGGRGFIWMKQVLSLRTPGGILTKEQLGWTGARTETTNSREVRHRYLFAIEDPFELEHNVARTVTHQGIVAIRDEFRRAQKILNDVWHGRYSEEGELMRPLEESLPAEREE